MLELSYPQQVPDKVCRGVEINHFLNIEEIQIKHFTSPRCKLDLV
jgi:hypothetical protein